MNNHLQQCYRLISSYYGDQRARRSGVPYINHIDEGLVVLAEIGASSTAKAAYCLHPILQDDDSLQANIDLVRDVDYRVLVTAMEYRNVANRGLSCFQVDDPDRIYLGPLKDVHDMLIADKVQNRKDFLVYHYGTHPKSKELDRYFCNWLRALDVAEADYDRMVAAINTISPGMVSFADEHQFTDQELLCEADKLARQIQRKLIGF